MDFARNSKWLALLAVMLLSGLSHAGQKVLVIDPRGPFLGKSLQDTANKTLRSLADKYDHLEFIRGSNLEKLQIQAGCKGTKAGCLKKIGRVVGAGKVLLVQTKKLPGRRMLILKLVNVSSGKVEKQSRQKIRKGKRSLVRALKMGWSSVFGKIVQCRIRVNANTENARVLLDGKPKGSTPLTLDEKLTAGYHTLTVLHEDTLPSERRIVIKPGRRYLKYMFQLKLKPSDDENLELVPLVPRSVKRPVKTVAKTKTGTGKDLNPKVASGALVPAKDSKTATSKDKDEPGQGLKSATIKDKGEPGQGLKSATLKDKDEPGHGLKTATTSEYNSKLFVPGQNGSAQPDEMRDESRYSTPVYKTWWFWTAVGVVAAAGIVTGTVIGLSGEGDSIPAGMGRVIIQF